MVIQKMCFDENERLQVAFLNFFLLKMMSENPIHLNVSKLRNEGQNEHL